MSDDMNEPFVTGEEATRLKELRAVFNDHRAPMSERSWAKARFDELTLVIARRALQWLFPPVEPKA